jgi:hypothetical protein
LVEIGIGSSLNVLHAQVEKAVNIELGQKTGDRFSPAGQNSRALEFHPKKIRGW